MDIKGKRLRLLFSDMLAIERGKYLFGDVADEGRAAFCIGLYPLTTDKEILEISDLQFDIGLPDVDAFIDRDTLRPGWEEDTVVGIADVHRQGKPLDVDPRQVLRTAVEPWRAMGLDPMFAFETEFYLLEPDETGGWRSVSLPSHRVYGTGMSVDPTGTIDDMVRAAMTSGFPIESWGSEYDTACYEVNVRYKEVIPAADECFLFRLLVKEIAARHGKLATFMGRPFDDRGGSGLHLNFSFRRDDGSNAFHDPNAPDGLSQLAKQCIAGALAHHEGVSALAAPHVNAYKRLQPDMLNGYWANWGFDDRTVCVRVPPARGEGSRLEHRMADGAANPYLAAAALLHAARFGVEHQMEPPPAQVAGEAPNTERRVPPTLEAALQALEVDDELCAALGLHVVETFSKLKLAEWERYAKAVEDTSTLDVTPWELEYYLPFF
ncbi:MAG TPA: glutamine synthetase family protein [Actinomycetota bacterium]|jgi:glutamine synthetase|nr:glutamine synthetase family protein [Actinomycetota bacterium]